MLAFGDGKKSVRKLTEIQWVKLTGIVSAWIYNRTIIFLMEVLYAGRECI